MSSLWTPSGEYTPRPEPAPQSPPTPGAPPPPGHADDDRPPTEDEMAAAAAEMREQILAAPVADVIVNSALGLFEIAALYLSAGPAKRDDARLAIDAFTAVVDAIGDRLGRHGPMLRDAASQLQLAFVNASAPAT